MTNATSIGQICCLALSLVLQHKVSFPGSPGYTASLGSYFSLQEASVHPSCIVSPETAQDVSVAVRILAKSEPLSVPSCHFAIRSGGHASSVGAANIPEGVTLDLSGLDAISLKETQKGDQSSSPIVSVGVGATWGNVYSYLEPFNLSVSGARAATVGVGGLLLGGGISYFGPRFGWACDGIVNIEVVLANGSVINANEKENASLLWGLRGGTNNLGVVTRVDLQTFGQGDLWGGFVVRPYSTADASIAALAAFADPAMGGYDEYASLITTFAYLGTENMSVIVNNMEYTRPVEEPPPVYQALTILPALTSTQRNTRLSGLVRETTMNSLGGLRQATATLTMSPTVAAITAAVRAWEASLPSLSKVDSVVWGLGFDPLPPALYARHPSGTNALGLRWGCDGGQHEALLIAHLTISWKDIADDSVVDTAVRDLVATIQRDVSALGDLDPFVYLNYAAAQEFDPRGIFTESVPGGFKIPQ
ncbi:putative oxidoreductase [Diaporthe sp. PMI_573]|nr:putative oxidoreductase [Diaporthaceae sp. PMI_573]